MHKLTVSLLFLAIALPAMAQEFLGDLEPEDPEVRRYTVEVIIFRYTQDVSTGSEIFPRDKPERGILPIDEDVSLLDEMPQDRGQEPRLLPDTQLVLLNKADFQLGNIMRRLERLDVYDPVMHFGWTQATWPEEQTAAIPLYRLARPPADLDGHLTLYLSRYLHLVVDLQIEAPGTTVFNVDERERIGDAQTVGGLLDEVNAPLPVHYRIQENRILKNGELRYYDHPKFGVLAKVTRVED